MSNTRHDRKLLRDVGSELVEYLAQLMKDRELQRQLPIELRREALQVVNRSQYSTAPKCEDILSKSFKTQATNYASARQQLNSHEQPAKPNTPIKIRILVPSNRSLSPAQNSQGSPHSPSPIKGYAKQQQAIRLIAVKQKELQNEKAYLEEQVAELKHLICEEKKSVDKNTKHSTRSSLNTDNALKNSRLVSKTLTDKQKKNLDILQQQKSISQELTSLSQQRSRVDKAIEEERDLVEMYKMVINELKAELKNQTKDRNNVKNNLLVSVNVLEKTKQKFELLYQKTRGLVGKVDEGMKGFFQ